MKIVIITQLLENYAAHDWDGQGECPQSWKSKFGSTYVISDVDITMGEFALFCDLIADKIVMKDDYFEEYIIDTDLVDDADFNIRDYCEHWEQVIELKPEVFLAEV